MENTYLHRALYAEGTAKLEGVSRRDTLEKDATWEDYLDFHDADTMTAERAELALHAFHRVPIPFRIHATGRIGLLAAGDPSARALTAEQLDNLRKYYRPETTNQHTLAHSFAYPLAQAFARTDNMEGIDFTVRLLDNAPAKLQAYAAAAKVIGESHSTASYEIAQELLAVPSLMATAIKESNAPHKAVTKFGDILTGALKRLYRDNPEATLGHAQASDEHALSLLKAIQQLGETAPDVLRNQLLGYSKQPETSDRTREHIVRLFIQGGHYDEALEVPTGRPVSKKLSSRENPRKEAYLLGLYSLGEFRKAGKLIGDSLDDGPDRARMREALIDYGDISLLRKYNLTNNGYRPRTDEVQIHIRRGDITTARQVVSEMPAHDTASGYLAIAESLVEQAPEDNYTVTDLQEFCTLALVANRKTEARMSCDWVHGRIFNHILSERRFADASAFRQLTLQNHELTDSDISSFHRQTTTGQARLLIRQGAYGEAMHGDHVDLYEGITSTTVLLGLVAALYPEVLRRTGQS